MGTMGGTKGIAEKPGGEHVKMNWRGIGEELVSERVRTLTGRHEASHRM